MTDNAQRRAIIIGGSISGLFAALLLRRTGWSVNVYERSSSELAGRGAGIVTHLELREAVREAGPDPDDRLGLHIDTRKMFDRSGRQIAEHIYPQIVTSWDRMFGVLLAHLPRDCYHLGRELVRYVESDRAIIAHFSDGSQIEGDLLIGADGIRSSVRAQALPDVAPGYANYVAWRGLVAESDISEQTHRDLFEYFCFCLPEGEQMLAYPVAGPNNELEKGKRRYNFVWYRPANESELQQLLTDETGHSHLGSIPPPLVRRENIESLLAASRRLLAPQFQEVVELSAKPFLQPIYDLVSPKLAMGRVAIIGDAAFVARPHVGAGVAKAAGDAVALAHALRSSPDNIVDALGSFERERIGIGRRIVERARQLGASIRTTANGTYGQQAGSPPIPSADRLIRETASMNFLKS